jgi:hypothetical protein
MGRIFQKIFFNENAILSSLPFKEPSKIECNIAQKNFPFDKNKTA